MADNGHPPPGMAFPQKIRSENEEYIVDLEENMHGGPDGYSLDDRGRCKRRKRCGQCGPCQVKENCMKCHFCVRKDVLKQTCIYRKCVYLRSKPKPYSRPHQSPQAPGRMSPSREVSQPSPAVKSPVSGIVSPGLPYGEQGMGEARPENPFFTPQLPQPPQSQPHGTLQNNGYSSPVPDRNQTLPGALGSSSMNMNMQVNNMNHHMQNNTASSPLQKLGEQASNPLGLSQSVNSPPAPVPGIPQISSCGNIPSIPSIPPVVPSIPSVIPPMSSNAIPGIPPIPAIPSMPGMNDRGINDFRSAEQLGLHPHHPAHHHFPAVPPVHPHPHMPHREANFFGDPSRMPHMNFTAPNHMDSFSRGPNDSSCMYHPSLQYSMPGHLQPSGPSFLSGAAEMNPFRSNFLNSFPPGYSYPPDRYREGFGTLPFSRLGMSSTAAFPQYPGQGAGYGMGNSFSNQYSPYNSQHGCPKNGSCPPVSPHTDDVKVLQEGYKKSYKSNDNVNDNTSDKLNDSGLGEGDVSISGDFSMWEELGYRSRPIRPDMSPGSDISRLWNCYTPKLIERSGSVSSVSSRSSLWEPWRSPSWFNTRLDDVRSRACSSRVSSDFECEVISVNDHQLNARIRSDGGNSIEIDFDDSSVCGSEFELSPDKSYSSQIGSRSSSKRALWTRGTADEKTRKPQIEYLKDPLCIMQDLGDEGMLQLELPGNKVSIQNIILDEKWLSKSNNTEELKRYIRRKL